MVYDRGFSVTYKEALANNNGNTYGPYDNKLFFYQIEIGSLHLSFQTR